MARSPTRARPPRGVALAAVTFALGLAVGAAVTAGWSGRQVMADQAMANPAPPQTFRGTGRQPMRGTHPADVLRVIDGDTFEARVHVWPGIEIITKVRLRGIDAPELKARCPQERDKAEAAREALRAMLAEGEVAVLRVSLDKYGGRVVADAATRGTPDVSAAMLATGHARAYSGGRRESWCDGL